MNTIIDALYPSLTRARKKKATIYQRITRKLATWAAIRKQRNEIQKGDLSGIIKDSLHREG